MSNTQQSSSGGVSFASLLASLLGILFIGLKLGHVISWPWVWVLSPLWIPLAFVLPVIAVSVIVGVIVSLSKGK